MIKRSKKTIKMIMLTNSLMMISTTKVLINLLKLLKIIVLNKRLPSRRPLNKDSSLLSNLRRLSEIGRLKRSNSTTQSHSNLMPIFMILLQLVRMISTTKVLINLLKLLKIIVLNKRLPSRRPLNKDSSLLSNLRRLSEIGRLKRSNSTTQSHSNLMPIFMILLQLIHLETTRRKLQVKLKKLLMIKQKSMLKSRRTTIKRKIKKLLQRIKKKKSRK